METSHPEKEDPANEHRNLTLAGNIDEASNDFSVWWNESETADPENPMNWPASRKWSIIGVLSMMTFLTYVTCDLQGRR
jgi:hypothetical protein